MFVVEVVDYEYYGVECFIEVGVVEDYYWVFVV